MTQDGERSWYRARTGASLGRAMADIRRAAGLSQTDLAEAVRSSRPTISRMERGLPVSSEVLVELLTLTGYEILLVPRGSHTTVAPPEAQS